MESNGNMVDRGCFGQWMYFSYVWIIYGLPTSLFTISHHYFCIQKFVFISDSCATATQYNIAVVCPRHALSISACTLCCDQKQLNTLRNYLPRVRHVWSRDNIQRKIQANQSTTIGTIYFVSTLTKSVLSSGSVTLNNADCSLFSTATKPLCDASYKPSSVVTMNTM